MSNSGFSKLTYLKGLRGQNISNGAYRVLLAVFNYTDEYGNNAHPGEHRLAEDTGLSDRSVRDYLKWLNDSGYLVKVRRGRGNGQGQGFATVYALGMPELPAESRRLVETEEGATGEISQATGEIPPSYRQDYVELPAKSRPLSDPSSDLPSDPKTSDPLPDDPCCQHCEDSPVNVCGLHFHDRKHRYREPASAALIARPVPRPSLPDRLVSNEKCCGVPLCGQARAPHSTFFCAGHLATFSSDLEETCRVQGRPRPVH